MAGQGLLITYYLQYQMATKDGKRLQSMSLRNTRRSKYLELKESKNLEAEVCRSQVQQKNHHDNNIEDHKQQENCPKNEKQSTSPPNNQPLNHTLSDEKLLRVTRSTALIPKKICSEVYLQNQLLTPEDNLVSKAADEPTAKKLVKMASAQSLPESKCLDMTVNVKKPISKVLQSGASPYGQVRKSYRRIHKNEIISIPYRKCHDAFEGRIVSILNKIQGGKNCLRDLESLVQRMQRITGKDMMNRYIIAGIATIIKLSKEKDIYDLKMIHRLEAEQHKLKLKILEQMDKTQSYQHNLVFSNQPIVDSNQYKRSLIRKLYKTMKMKQRKDGSQSGINDLREKAIRDCERFFQCEATVGDLIKFIKQKIDVLQQ